MQCFLDEVGFRHPAKTTVAAQSKHPKCIQSHTDVYTSLGKATPQRVERCGVRCVEGGNGVHACEGYISDPSAGIRAELGMMQSPHPPHRQVDMPVHARSGIKSRFRSIASARPVDFCIICFCFVEQSVPLFPVRMCDIESFPLPVEHSILCRHFTPTRCKLLWQGCIGLGRAPFRPREHAYA